MHPGRIWLSISNRGDLLKAAGNLSVFCKLNESFPLKATLFWRLILKEKTRSLEARWSPTSRPPAWTRPDPRTRPDPDPGPPTQDPWPRTQGPGPALGPSSLQLVFHALWALKPCDSKKFHQEIQKKSPRNTKKSPRNTKKITKKSKNVIEKTKISLRNTKHFTEKFKIFHRKI